MRKNKQVKVSVWQRVCLIILGVFLSLVILEIGLRVGGFVLLSLQEYKNRLSLKQKGVYRIMCLGESTTQGQYPGFLEEILNQRNIGITFSVIDKGVTAASTAFILSQLEANLETYKPDMVVAMMGINDAEKFFFSDETVNGSQRPSFFRQLKVCKLLNLCLLHITAKTKEIKFYRQKNEQAYIELGDIYKDQGEYLKAEGFCKKAIELNPRNDSIYVKLGDIYKEQIKFIEAEVTYKKAIELNPRNDSAYAGLGFIYIHQKKFSEAEDFYNKAIELNSQNDFVHEELGYLYRCQKKFSKMEDTYKKSIELNPYNVWGYAGLESIYFERDNLELFKEYMEKTRQACRREYKAVTINNYLKVKKTLDKRNIRLVCAQYPMLNIKPLKKIFEGQKGVIFVDNEKTFKDAVKSDGLKAYFKNMCNGDFGHCTDKGNKLLARNIADAILKAGFKK
ncbi:MAG: tetratricopeptide repeat protein [Candidatus Omnitrophota bacterium]|nr:tetratricopeptide repeat protein [Candidatus Omnitrophota bacterium]